MQSTQIEQNHSLSCRKEVKNQEAWVQTLASPFWGFRMWVCPDVSWGYVSQGSARRNGPVSVFTSQISPDVFLCVSLCTSATRKLQNKIFFPLRSTVKESYQPSSWLHLFSRSRSSLPQLIPSPNEKNLVSLNVYLWTFQIHYRGVTYK